MSENVLMTKKYLQNIIEENIQYEGSKDKPPSISTIWHYSSNFLRIRTFHPSRHTSQAIGIDIGSGFGNQIKDQNKRSEIRKNVRDSAYSALKNLVFTDDGYIDIIDGSSYSILVWYKF